MKTAELVKLLKPLYPCYDGIQELSKHTTVVQAFNSAKCINHILFVWFAVACVDTDDVFLNELISWCASHIIEPYLPRQGQDNTDLMKRRLMWNARRFRDNPLDYPLRFTGAFENDTRNAKLCDMFRAEFRCPTDAELRTLKRIRSAIRHDY